MGKKKLSLRESKDLFARSVVLLFSTMMKLR